MGRITSSQDIIDAADVDDIEGAKAALATTFPDFESPGRYVLGWLFTSRLFLQLPVLESVDFRSLAASVIYRLEIAFQLSSKVEARYGKARSKILRYGKDIKNLHEIDLEGSSSPELLYRIYQSSLWYNDVIHGILIETFNMHGYSTPLSEYEWLTLMLLIKMLTSTTSLEQIEENYHSLSEDTRHVFDGKMASLRTQLIMARDVGLKLRADLLYCTDIPPVHREQSILNSRFNPTTLGKN